ncbi:uncharacterized protein [Oscarella lobularis]|uniref:uncharacterized protein n=1 Tax=Oscarella lobularis TaxID=121494 RepID=UPI003313A4FA
MSTSSTARHPLCCHISPVISLAPEDEDDRYMPTAAVIEVGQYRWKELGGLLVSARDLQAIEQSTASNKLRLYKAITTWETKESTSLGSLMHRILCEEFGITNKMLLLAEPRPLYCTEEALKGQATSFGQKLLNSFSTPIGDNFRIARACAAAGAEKWEDIGCDLMLPVEKFDKIKCSFSSNENRLYHVLLSNPRKTVGAVLAAFQRNSVDVKEIQNAFDHLDSYEAIFEAALQRGAVKVNRCHVIVVGQDGTGKSCLVNSLLNEKFEENKASTDGAAHVTALEWSQTDRAFCLDKMFAQACFSTETLGSIKKEEEELEEYDKYEDIYEDIYIYGDDLSRKSELWVPPTPSPPTSPPTSPPQRQASLPPNFSSPQTPPPTPLQRSVSVSSITTPRRKYYFDELRRKSDEMATLNMKNISDLGGQEVYLATHSALMPNDSKSVVYVVVTDISKKLSDKATPSFRPKEGGKRDLSKEMGWVRQNRDFLLYWFGAITVAHDLHSLSELNELSDDDDDTCSAAEVNLPPVLVIGTHIDELEKKFPSDTDSVKEWLEDQKSLFETLIDGNKIVEHIFIPRKKKQCKEFAQFIGRIFLVNNTLSGSCLGIKQIKETIDSFCNERVQPLFWVYLEICLMDWKKNNGTAIAKVEDVITVAHDPQIGIRNPQEVLAALKFLSSLGVVFYYPDVPSLKDYVFTDPTWVINALTSFVTARPPLGKFERAFKNLKETGIMKMSLMRHRFKNAGLPWEDEKERNAVIHFLQQLDIITDCVASESSEFYYVPSILTKIFDDDPLWKTFDHEGPFPPPLLVIPTTLQFIPEYLFFRLVTRYLRLYQDKDSVQDPQLSRHCCVFMSSLTKPRLQIELLYHNRGKWIALTVGKDKRIPALNDTSNVFNDIRRELHREMTEVCNKGMKGFSFHLCCQLNAEAEIDVKSMPILTDEYDPSVPDLYSLKKQVLLSEKEYNRINRWFKSHRSDPSAAAAAESDGSNKFPDGSSPVNDRLKLAVAHVGESAWDVILLYLGFSTDYQKQLRQDYDKNYLRLAKVIEDWQKRSPEVATVERLLKICDKSKIGSHAIKTEYEQTP